MQQRDLSTMFPGYFQTTTKRDHYVDFGWPKTLTFDHFYQMYDRNGFASAAVDKTVAKTWETSPSLQENEDAEDVTKTETALSEHLESLQFWQKLAEADTRALVGGYAGVILRFRDGKRFHEPVDDNFAAGFEYLIEVIPAWAGQLIVGEWDYDEFSENYGKPKMYMFVESAVSGSNQAKNRSFDVHPDRVVIWSKDGTTEPRSLLKPGYNHLIDAEKVIGAGGEGFWKSAKASPILEVDPEATIEKMAAAMGVAKDKVLDAMDEQVKDFQTGFDAMLMLQGMKATPMSVTLEKPAEFVNVALQPFAASVQMPIKILVGMQTGERASEEDAREWNQTNMSRRENFVIPRIMEIVARLVKFGVMPEAMGRWTLAWPDLTESSMGEKTDRAVKMTEMNAKHVASGAEDTLFTGEEIRETMGYTPLEDAEGEDDE